MPRRTPLLAVLVSLSLFAGILTTGCTAIGFGIGAAIDSGNARSSPSRLLDVREGRRVTLWMHDGRRLEGHYMGSRTAGQMAAAEPGAGADSLAAPPRAVIILESFGQRQDVPLDGIHSVSVPTGTGKKIGLITGLTLDTLFVISAIMAASTAFH